MTHSIDCDFRADILTYYVNATVGRSCKRLGAWTVGVVASGNDSELRILVTMQGQGIPKPRITSSYKDSLVLQRGPVELSLYVVMSHICTIVWINTDRDTDLLDQNQANSPPATMAEP